MIDTDKYEGHTPAPWDWDGTILTNHEAIHWDYGTKGVDIVDICGTMSMTQEPDLQLVADAPLLLEQIKKMQEDTLKVVSDWFDVYGGDENEWRKLEQALRLPLTPLSWEGEEE
jgi:hypothetical protein|tara:strand:+ start:674 stop:1015 length:342 start_codon:yes stop_codon:yes gene_type:complete